MSNSLKTLYERAMTSLTGDWTSVISRKLLDGSEIYIGAYKDGSVFVAVAIPRSPEEYSESDPHAIYDRDARNLSEARKIYRNVKSGHEVVGNKNWRLAW